MDSLPLIYIKDYAKDYILSIENPAEFWAAQAKEYVSWYTPWHTVVSGNFSKGTVRWFDGATLNVSYNCLDRHLQGSSAESVGDRRLF